MFANIAAALVLAASVSAPALAVTTVDLEPAQPTLETASAELAVYCEYVIVWDAFGNAYYEYYCY